jgi:hypothetical protein
MVSLEKEEIQREERKEEQEAGIKLTVSLKKRKPVTIIKLDRGSL